MLSYLILRSDFRENDKKPINEFISRHLDSNSHTGMSRDLTTALTFQSFYVRISEDRLSQ